VPYGSGQAGAFTRSHVTTASRYMY